MPASWRPKTSKRFVASWDMALARFTEQWEDAIVSQPQHLNIGGVYFICTRTVCGGVWARTFESTSGHVGPEKNRVTAVCQSELKAVEVRAIHHATVVFLAPGLGPQIRSLPCLPQRARSWFWDQNWTRFWTPKTYWRECFFGQTCEHHGGVATWQDRKGKGRVNAECCRCAWNTWSHATALIWRVFALIWSSIFWAALRTLHLKRAQKVRSDNLEVERPITLTFQILA